MRDPAKTMSRHSSKVTKEITMEEALRLNPDTAELASDEAHESSLSRCEHVLELMLTPRGNPSAEVERVLADDPQSVFGHCLRAALIVCADAAAERSSLAASVAAIEAACPACTIRRAVTQARHALGSRVAQLLRSNATPPS